MRRATVGPVVETRAARARLRCACLVTALSLADAVSTSGGCIGAYGSARDGLPRASAGCPRQAAVGPDGRCVCADADVLTLGACVPRAIAEAYCGSAAALARLPDGREGCAFRACGPNEQLDVVSGECGRIPASSRGIATTCPSASVPIMADGHVECVVPEAACPRGADERGNASADAGGAISCVRPPGCPPGTLPEGAGCKAIVTTLVGAPGVRVDVGGWAARALGIDGGAGSTVLCRPLAQRPSLFATGASDSAASLGWRGVADASAGASGSSGGGDVAAQQHQETERTEPTQRAVLLAISIVFPDQDVSRLHAEVRARDAAGRPLAGPAQALAFDAIGTVVEVLRGLGGEASAASVHLDVRCAVVPAAR